VARGILDSHIPLETAVKQWGNLAGLVAGLYREDYDLIGRSLADFVAEPKRAGLIRAFMNSGRQHLHQVHWGPVFPVQGLLFLHSAGERSQPQR
jgi:homoserine kinase